MPTDEQPAAQVQRDPFADDVLERLIASNQDYQRGHGHYIVPLAERLLAARADNTRLREEIRIREESQIPVIPHGAAVQLERLQVEVERLLAWHDKTVPVIAALAIYGEGASLPALVEKARALNEAPAATALPDVLMKCSICDSQFPTAVERDAHYGRCLSQHDPQPTHLGMKLTRLQEDVLLVVEENGPVTPRDVAYHLPIGEASARGALTRLEAKNLVAATYTGHHRGSGRAYVARA